MNPSSSAQGTTLDPYLPLIAHYQETGIPSYQGNPLIEALPPILTPEEASTTLRHLPT